MNIFRARSLRRPIIFVSNGPCRPLQAQPRRPCLPSVNLQYRHPCPAESSEKPQDIDFFCLSSSLPVSLQILANRFKRTWLSSLSRPSTGAIGWFLCFRICDPVFESPIQQQANLFFLLFLFRSSATGPWPKLVRCCLAPRAALCFRRQQGPAQFQLLCFFSPENFCKYLNLAKFISFKP
jgi:hypothetical protein